MDSITDREGDAKEESKTGHGNKAKKYVGIGGNKQEEPGRCSLMVEG
jgi:hypothetical protein